MSKEKGELGELEFIVRALRIGLKTSIPWGDSLRYDCIVDNGAKLNRIQIKTVSSKSVLVAYGSNKKHPYSSDDCYFVAVLYTPLMVFYIFPIELFKNCMRIYLGPENPDHKYNEYVENWDLLLS